MPSKLESVPLMSVWQALSYVPRSDTECAQHMLYSRSASISTRETTRSMYRFNLCARESINRMGEFFATSHFQNWPIAINSFWTNRLKFIHCSKNVKLSFILKPRFFCYNTKSKETLHIVFKWIQITYNSSDFILEIPNFDFHLRLFVF